MAGLGKFRPKAIPQSFYDASSPETSLCASAKRSRFFYRTKKLPVPAQRIPLAQQTSARSAALLVDLTPDGAK